MRPLLIAAAAGLSLAAVPAALSAQQTQPGGPESAADANAQSQPAPPTTTVTTSDTIPAQTTVTIDNPGNSGPPPEASLNKSYPICTSKMQDNCQNRGEGGAPGRSRATRR